MPNCERLDSRQLLSGTVSLGAYGSVSAFAGVRFALNPVATASGTEDGAPDDNLSDYSAEIDWGDGGGFSSTGVELAAVGYAFLIKGSHTYQTANTFPITVLVFGPEGSSTKAQTSSANVSLMPDAASRPPAVPTSYGGTKAPGDDYLGFSGYGTISSFAGVGFALNPVGTVTGTYNSQNDNTPGDYHAQINWGDSPSWDTNVGLAAVGNAILIKGSHVYQRVGTYDVTVYVTGPDGQTGNYNLATAVVTRLPDPASLPPEVPASFGGPEPLGNVNLNFSGSGTISATAGVNFAGASLGSVTGTYNGPIDISADDYHLQVNWGDTPEWVGGIVLPLPGKQSLFLYGSHTYAAAGTYAVTVYVTGPDGQTASDSTTSVNVALAPTPTPSPSPSPTPTPTSPTPTPTATAPSFTPLPPGRLIANAQQLAGQVFNGYNGTPIQIAKVLNHRKTYVVMLSGTEPGNPKQPTSLYEDALSDAGKPDYYYLAIFKAIRAHIPAGAHVILAGHSLGGMEAQNIANDAWLKRHYRITNVVTFGSPKTQAPLRGSVTYTEFTLRGDPVTILSPTTWPSNDVQVIDNPWEFNVLTIDGHLEYPVAPGLEGYDALGQPGGQSTLRLGPIKGIPVRAPGP